MKFGVYYVVDNIVNKITIEEIFASCAKFNAQKNKTVDDELFNRWLSLEKPDNYEKTDTIASRERGGNQQDIGYIAYLSEFKSGKRFNIIPQNADPIPYDIWVNSQYNAHSKEI